MSAAGRRQRSVVGRREGIAISTCERRREKKNPSERGKHVRVLFLTLAPAAELAGLGPFCFFFLFLGKRQKVRERGFEPGTTSLRALGSSHPATEDLCKYTSVFSSIV